MTAPSRLLRWERLGLALFAAFWLAFGGLVLVRSALQTERKTDFGVYLRAAWAIRTGGDLYGIADDRGWHYCYPPPFAALLMPLADPPAGEARTGFLPFGVSVVVWYLFSLGCVAFTVHKFAGAVLPEEPRGTRRWWYARTVPVYVAIGGVGYTLARGQVNLLLVALIAGMFAAVAAGRRRSAGAWLGAAFCLKVIPAYLGVYVLMKRDTRLILGGLLALIVGLGVIPVMFWGVDGAIAVNRTLLADVLQPGSTGTGDQTRAKELTNATATDSQSFQAAIHNWTYPEAATRPAVVAGETRLAHWLIGGVLTLVVVGVWRQCAIRTPRSASDLTLLGTLTLLMAHLTPVSHMHYYALGLPLVCGLWLKGLAERPQGISANFPTVLVLAFWGIATAVPLFPGETCEILRERGCGLAASLVLIGYAAATARMRAERVTADTLSQTPAGRRAA